MQEMHDIKTQDHDNRRNHKVRGSIFLERPYEMTRLPNCEYLWAEIDVCPDNTCLFYAVALGALLPVLKHNEEFAKRYSALFGEDKNENAIRELQEILEDFDGSQDFIPKNAVQLEVLANVDLRQRVVDYMRKYPEDYKEKIAHEKSEDYVTLITDSEYETYLTRMANPKGSWGGLIEVDVMSRLLEIPIVTYEQESDRKVRKDGSNGDGQDEVIRIVFTKTSSESEYNNHFHVLLDPQLIPKHNTANYSGKAGNSPYSQRSGFFREDNKLPRNVASESLISYRKTSMAYAKINDLGKEPLRAEAVIYPSLETALDSIDYDYNLENPFIIKEFFIIAVEVNPDGSINFYNNLQYKKDYIIKGNSIIRCCHFMDKKSYEIIFLENKKTDFPDIKYANDLDYIEYALELIEFILANKEILRTQLIISEYVALALICIYKISDAAKNRNLEIAPETGWRAFELLINLLIKESSEYLHFKFYMLPKIIDEDLEQIKKLLQQLHDTEIKILQEIKNEENLKFFKGNIGLLEKIVNLQINIEQGIKASEDVSKSKEELTQLIKENNLKSEFSHIEFFSKTINNYYSLKKIISLIEKLEHKSNFLSLESKEGFLFALVQIGEYMTHKNLTNQFRQYYQKIEWDSYQIIRDCLEHPDENGNYSKTKDLLNEFDFNALLREIIQLKTAINAILNREYAGPSIRFMEEYFRVYENLGIYSYPITEEESKFFINNLVTTDEELIQKWKLILSGEIRLPDDRKELSKLQVTMPKAIDINKEKRKECETIITKLGSPDAKVTQIDLKYLHCNLKSDEDTDNKINTILSKEKITRQDKQILRRFMPGKVLTGNIKEIQECERIFKLLIDIRDQGNNILYPSEKKEFNKTKLYKGAKDKWSRILGKKELPNIEDIQDLEKLDDDNLKNIRKKIIEYVFPKLEERWLKKLTAKDLKQFISLLNNYTIIKKKWLKILNDELEYPSNYREDILEINKISHVDANLFISLTLAFKPIVCPSPILKNLAQLFISPSSQNFVGNDLIELSREYLNRVSSISHKYIECTEDFAQKLLYHYMTKYKNPHSEKIYSEHPNFQKFVNLRDTMIKEARLESMRTAQPFKIPEEEITSLMNKMFGEDFIAKTRNDFEMSEEIGNAMSEVSDKLFSEKLRIAEFKKSILFNLTAGLGLLKKIDKLQEGKKVNFLQQNYLTIKKLRNQLAHGDYVKKSFGISSDHTIKQLKLIIPHLIDCLEQLLRDREKANRAKVRPGSRKKKIKPMVLHVSFFVPVVADLSCLNWYDGCISNKFQKELESFFRDCSLISPVFKVYHKSANELSIEYMGDTKNITYLEGQLKKLADALGEELKSWPLNETKDLSFKISLSGVNSQLHIASEDPGLVSFIGGIIKDSRNVGHKIQTSYGVMFPVKPDQMPNGLTQQEESNGITCAMQ